MMASTVKNGNDRLRKGNRRRRPHKDELLQCPEGENPDWHAHQTQPGSK